MQWSWRKRRRALVQRMIRAAFAKRRGRRQRCKASDFADERCSNSHVLSKADICDKEHYRPIEIGTQQQGSLFNFEVDRNDHCETDIKAYRHLVPLLRRLAHLCGVLVREDSPICDLRLWDPYYCQGAVCRNMASLGFRRVHNKNEDFYAVIRELCEPEYDVLLSNPPYSGDHIERCVRYCASSGKPWCLLLPNWVCAKDWYQEMLQAGAFGAAQPFFLGPVRQAYGYRIPRGFWRPDHVGADGRTTPYLSSWFIHLPTREAFHKLFSELEAEEQSDWVVAQSLQGLKEKARKLRAPTRQAFKLH